MSLRVSDDVALCWRLRFGSVFPLWPFWLEMAPLQLLIYCRLLANLHTRYCVLRIVNCKRRLLYPALSRLIEIIDIAKLVAAISTSLRIAVIAGVTNTAR